MKKLLFANLKGGVGKTVSSVSLAHALSLLQRRILLIDADPQGNASNWIEVKNIEYELADILQQDIDPVKAINKTKQGFDFICTFPDGDLRTVSELLCSKKPFIFHDLLDNIYSNYDFVLIDSSPSFSPLERSLCLGIEEIICPVELEFFAVDGLHEFDKIIQDFNKNWKQNIVFNKIILTKENKSFSRHTALVSAITKNVSGYSFFHVRQDSLLAESIGLNQTIFERNENAKSAKDYMNIAMFLNKST